MFTSVIGYFGLFIGWWLLGGVIRGHTDDAIVPWVSLILTLWMMGSCYLLMKG